MFQQIMALGLNPKHICIICLSMKKVRYEDGGDGHTVCETDI